MITTRATPARAEVALLLCLARARPGPSETERIDNLLAGPFDWEEFLRLAARHHLLPLCARHLGELAPPRAPAAAMRAMRDHATRTVRRSLLLTAELLALLALLRRAGIPAVAYKGPALAEELYGNVGLRDMLDLDILVRKHDALRARALFADRGYRSAVPTGPRWDAWRLRSGCSVPLIHEATGLVVELHWTPETCVSQPVLDVLWQRLEHVSLAGEEVPTFARQDLLFLLSLHGGRHMWERLEWLVGAAELLRVVDVAWDELLRLASSVGGRRALLLAVTLADRLLEAPVPEHVLRQARADSRMEPLVEAACEQLFSAAPVLAHQRGFSFHHFQLRSKERLVDRIGYVARRFIAPSMEEWEACRLPWSLFRVRCAVRRLGVAAAYGVWLWRRRTPMGFANVAHGGGTK